MFIASGEMQTKEANREVAEILALQYSNARRGRKMESCLVLLPATTNTSFPLAEEMGNAVLL